MLMMTKTAPFAYPRNASHDSPPNPPTKHDYETEHHDMTSIRQYEQHVNEYLDTERRNENDNPQTCKLVEEDRTILELTAQPYCRILQKVEEMIYPKSSI